jgi:hypothetical protein
MSRDSPEGKSTMMPTLTADEMAALLDEPNVELLARVIEVLGPARAEALLDDTLRLEADGGLRVQSGRRRRTPGGVFFSITKRTTPAPLRWQIFPRPMAAPRARPIPPCRWRDVNEMLDTCAQHPTGEATVKITLIGRPLAVEARGQAVMFQLKGTPPPSLPRGLPPLPPRPPILWTVLVALRQWNKVKERLAADPADKLIIEGYPLVENDLHLVMANSCRSILMQREEKAQQQAAAS